MPFVTNPFPPQSPNRGLKLSSQTHRIDQTILFVRHSGQNRVRSDWRGGYGGDNPSQTSLPGVRHAASGRGGILPRLRVATSRRNPSDSVLLDISSELCFEHYQVLKNDDGMPIQLGRGGMGVTYKAIGTHLRCPVALKVIGAQFIGNESVHRREGQLCSFQLISIC